LVAFIREERRLRVFENRTTRRIYGPKRDEVTGKWRRLGKEELNEINSSADYSGDRIKKNEMGGACNTYGGEQRCIQSFDGET